MDKTPSPEGIIRIPATPPIKEKFAGQDLQPDLLDSLASNLNVPAYLLNVHFAIPVKLSSLGIEQAVFIPVQISSREGSRKSLFFLDQGEEVLVGIYVTNQGIALRYMKRETGTSRVAQTGDIYSTRITNREGQPIFEGKGELEVTDPLMGNGYFHTTGMVVGSPIPVIDDGIGLKCVLKSNFYESQ